jgi:zinc D-Ala-D-Ala carboxypeptidase
MNKPKDYPYFKAAELACKCDYPNCHRHDMSDHFMFDLIAIREKLPFPLLISSGFRCPAHNNDVSTTEASGPHTMGLAVDIRIAGIDARVLVDAAVKHEFWGIGIKQHGARGRRFIHLDMMPRPGGRVIWSY